MSLFRDISSTTWNIMSKFKNSIIKGFKRHRKMRKMFGYLCHLLISGVADDHQPAILKSLWVCSQISQCVWWQEAHVCSPGVVRRAWTQSSSSSQHIIFDVLWCFSFTWWNPLVFFILRQWHYNFEFAVITVINPF